MLVSLPLPTVLVFCSSHYRKKYSGGLLFVFELYFVFFFSFTFGHISLWAEGKGGGVEGVVVDNYCSTIQKIVVRMDGQLEEPEKL